MSETKPLPPYHGETWEVYRARIVGPVIRAASEVYAERARFGAADTPPAFGEWTEDAYQRWLDAPAQPTLAEAHRRSLAASARYPAYDVRYVERVTRGPTSGTGEAAEPPAPEAEPLPTLPPSHVGAFLRGLRADLRALDPAVEFTVEREVGAAMGECVVVRWRSPAPDGGAPWKNTLRSSMPDLGWLAGGRLRIVEQVRKGLARYGAMRETLTVERPAGGALFGPDVVTMLRAVAGESERDSRWYSARFLNRVAALIEGSVAMFDAGDVGALRRLAERAGDTDASERTFLRRIAAHIERTLAQGGAVAAEATTPDRDGIRGVLAVLRGGVTLHPPSLRKMADAIEGYLRLTDGGAA